MALDLRQPDPMDFSGNLADSWKTFISAFTFYRDALDISKRNQKTQCAILLHVIGKEAQEVYKTFSFEEGEANNYQILVNKFEETFLPQANTIYERFLFNKRNQREKESFDSFLKDIKTQVNQCAYGDMKDELLRDRIVVGITSESMQEKLLQTKDLTLQKAIDMCKASVVAKTQAAGIKQASAEVEESISKLKIDRDNNATSNSNRSDYRNNQNRGRRGNIRRQTSQITQCDYCGGSHQRGNCPAWGKTCGKCGKQNHYTSKCWSKHVNTMNYQAEDSANNYDSDPDQNECMFIGAIDSQESEKHEWKETIDINNCAVTFKLDTGAPVNTMSLKTFKSIKGNTEKIANTNVRLISYSEHPISPLGTVKLPCTIKKKSHQIVFHITREDLPNLLGVEACEKAGLIKRMNNISSEQTKQSVLQNFSDLFSGIGCLPEKHKIKLKQNCQPVINAPRRYPYTLKKTIIEEIERLEKMGIVKPVHEPTEWVNSLVVISKPNGGVRVCMDADDLNKAIIPSKYKLKTIEEVIANIPDAKYFSKLDGVKGFWQIQLDEESSKLCTFNTPIGRYRFTRLPFGICDASEVFQELMEKYFGEFASVIIDDLLISGVTKEEHDRKLLQVLNRARQINFKFNVNKLEIGASEVTYAGHLITSEGVKPDPEKVAAIVNMPDPLDKDKLRSFLGMCNYLIKFIPHLSHETAPLRNLMKKDVEFIWDTPQINAFKKIKQLIAESAALTYYDVNKPVTLQVDASKDGLGGCLLQEGKPVAYASASLTDTQTRYSQIEKEMLAVVFATKKFHHYIYGKKTKIHTDHKPLESIFKKPLCKAPPRLSRMLLTLRKYKLELIWKPGKEMHIADALSRVYLADEIEFMDTREYDIEVYNLKKHLPVSPEKYEEFQKETQKDPEAIALKNVLLNGWPTYHNDLEGDLKPFWADRDELHIIDGIIFKGNRIFVPKTMRSEILKTAHESHFGIQKTIERATSILYWHKMRDDIENEIRNCDVCLKFRKSNKKEPMIPHEVPDRAWQEIAIDFFELKGSWMVVVDYYSSFFELTPMKSTNAPSVIVQLKSMFARHGIPETVYSDNGPPFNSNEFSEFSKSYSFATVTSSPKYAQSNGKVENAVSTAKAIINKAKDPYIALMEYRASPVTGLDKSPAELMFNRNIRTKLPCTSDKLSVSPASNLIKEKIQFNKAKQSFYYNRSAGPKLPELQQDDHVMFKKEAESEWRPAVVKGKVNIRSYNVEDERGRIFRRNRKFIHKPPQSHEKQETAPQQPVSDTNTTEPRRSARIMKQQSNRL